MSKRLPLSQWEADLLMSAVRKYGEACRREVRAEGDREQWLFRRGRTDAARLEIQNLLRGDYPPEPVNEDDKKPVTVKH